MSERDNRPGTDAAGPFEATSSAPEEDGGRGVEGWAFEVRHMEKSDLGAVMAIERASFASPWTLATFAGLLRRENTRLWVAESAGEVIAYAAVWMVTDQAELGDLAVAGGWRRRGVGTRMLESILAEMRDAEIRELFLEVRESNTDARRLYGRHGFEPVGRRPGYYTGPKEDALVLRRRLEHGR